MEDDTARLNALWAEFLVEELISQGVDYFCVAPGLRNSPLIIAMSKHPLARLFVHFDERALCFHALGFAKATGRVAVLAVTSGTAVGNLLPGIMEAHHSSAPLLVLTADRPAELRHTDANQTTDQVKIFQNFMRWQVDLPSPDRRIPPSFIGSTIAHAVSKSEGVESGPVHLNCMFREPLFEDREPIAPSKGSETSIFQGECFLSKEQTKQVSSELLKHKKGIIIVGEIKSHSSLTPLFRLSNLLKWPLFPDILSPIRSHSHMEEIIGYCDLILKSLPIDENFLPDAILQMGDRFVSKKLLNWITFKKPKCHVQIVSNTHFANLTHSVTHRVIANPWHLIEHLLHHLPCQPPSYWSSEWQRLNRTTKKAVADFFRREKALTGPSFFHHLPSWIPTKTPLFIGNSLPIREADSFFFPLKESDPLFGNRGLSGIDGNISTAAGISRGLQRSTFAIVGDLTFLHDLTSLFHLKESPCPLKLIVINNDGGGIFSFFPVGQKTHFSHPFFLLSHGLDLKKSADFLKIPYQKATSLEEMEQFLKKQTSTLTIIEMVTDKEENFYLHKQIIAHVKESLKRTHLLQPY